MTFLLFSFLTVFAHAVEIPTYFTTLFYDDGGIVYVGLKTKQDEASDSQAQLVSFPFIGGEKTKIELPPELRTRSIVGVIPDRKKVYVISQDEESAQKSLMLHIHDLDQEVWKKLGQMACPTFTKVKTAAKAITVYCERKSAPTKNKKKARSSGVQAKVFSLGKERLYRRGTWRFPEFLLRYKGVTLILEGNAPYWSNLRLKSPDGERIIKAEDLVDHASLGPVIEEVK